MWVVRELLRLIFHIAVAVAIAIVVAGLWALVSSGSFVHALRIAFFLVGALLLLLSGTGNRGTMSNRRVMRWSIMSGFFGSDSFPMKPTRPDQRTLTASAVFVGSGAVLIVLGALV
jgi:hypothetical protein